LSAAPNNSLRRSQQKLKDAFGVLALEFIHLRDLALFFRPVPSAITLVRWVNESAFASMVQARPIPTLADRFTVGTPFGMNLVGARHTAFPRELISASNQG